MAAENPRLPPELERKYYANPRWPMTERLLNGCKQLLLVVFLTGEEAEAAELADQEGRKEGITRPDTRMVVTWFKTWYEGVLDCDSYWEVAGDFAVRKRQGLIKGTDRQRPVVLTTHSFIESCFLAERD
ncbi:hypothetical protein C8F01DRAFT_1084688 [Mycena amicta]|nr:hypothetical protein C8F01DRAFT_1084688 [Mycena amicta]